MKHLLPRQGMKKLKELKGKSVIVDYITGYEGRHIKAGRLEEITADFLRVDKVKIFLGRGEYPTQAVLEVIYLTNEDGPDIAYTNVYYRKLLNTQGTLARKKGALTLGSSVYPCRRRG